MPSGYNETITFPTQIDLFPSLEDNTGSAISNTQIVFAEHHNKIANFAGVIQPLLSVSYAATGDQTLRGLGYVFKLSATIPQLFSVYGGVAASSAAVIQPGNVLPFEFILTYSSDVYKLWQDRGPNIILQLTTNTDLFNQAGGGLNLFTTNPLVTATISSTNNGGFAIGTTTRYIVNTYCTVGANILVVRGALIDKDMPPVTNQANSERWLQTDAVLNITVMGVG